MIKEVESITCSLNSVGSINGELNNKVIETGNYKNLENKPSINNIELDGNKSFEDLGMNEVFATKEYVNTLIQNSITTALEGEY